MLSAQVLGGIRVVDFSSGPAGGLATTVLADFGADVIKVEPPSGDRFRSLVSSPFWLRGKRSVLLDLADEQGRTQARALAETADVVVVSGSPDRVRSWGLDGNTLLGLAPSLIHCSLTGWGNDGPYAEWAGYEGLVAAKSGRMASFDVQLRENRPVYAAVQVGTHAASQAAVHGIVAALYRRSMTGVGQMVETSLLQCLMPFDLVDVLSVQIAERDGTEFTSLRKLSEMPTLNYHPVRTSDGQWIQCGNLLEHLFYSFLDAVDLLGELLNDERFQGSPAVWTPETIEEARDRILIRVQERTAAEWMSIFEANGNVAAEIVRTTPQALHHQDLVLGGCLVEVMDPDHGPTTQIGPIAELVEMPAMVDRGAPSLGQHNDEILRGDAASGTASVSGSGSAKPGRPLDGVTIIDLSTIIAGPLATSMLADLGARVIKVEPYGGDPFRQLLIEGLLAVKTNVGKESICIDLKTIEGQALLHELVAGADVVVHNFRGDVPNKLGLSYEELRAVKPDIIWAVINGYGPYGPSAKRPATHPVMGAASGGVAYQAGQAVLRDCPTLEDVRENARQIMVANEANPDPNTSVVAVSAILLALLGRERHGAGQVVRINMQVGNAWANFDDFLEYADKPERRSVDAGHHGLHAGYRLYSTSDGWVFLAITNDPEFERYCRVAGCESLLADARFANAASRLEHDGDLVDKLSELFLARPAAEWEQLLTSAGVGCVRADDVDVGRFFTSDPHVIDSGWVPLVDHLRFGRLRRWGPIVTVDGLNPDYRGAPLAGEHTDNLLTELGKDDATIAHLRETKVVNSESV